MADLLNWSRGYRARGGGELVLDLSLSIDLSINLSISAYISLSLSLLRDIHGAFFRRNDAMESEWAASRKTFRVGSNPDIPTTKTLPEDESDGQEGGKWLHDNLG